MRSFCSPRIRTVGPVRSAGARFSGQPFRRPRSKRPGSASRLFTSVARFHGRSFPVELLPVLFEPGPQLADPRRADPELAGRDSDRLPVGQRAGNGPLVPRQGSQPVRPVDPSGGRLGRTGRVVLNEDFSPLTTTPQPTTWPSKMLKEKMCPAAPQDGPALRSLIAKSLARNRPSCRESPPRSGSPRSAAAESTARPRTRPPAVRRGPMSRPRR